MLLNRLATSPAYCPITILACWEPPRNLVIRMGGLLGTGLPAGLHAAATPSIQVASTAAFFGNRAAMAPSSHSAVSVPAPSEGNGPSDAIRASGTGSPSHVSVELFCLASASTS
eukprot:scaffold148_cov144-Isochrysis_galbana.AAC.1